MIGPTGSVRVLVATKPVDFRKGAEGLAALVRETMGADPFSGAVYVFRAKRADRVKLIFWDGTGVCVSSSWCLSKAGFDFAIRCSATGLRSRRNPCLRGLRSGTPLLEDRLRCPEPDQQDLPL